MRHNPNPQEMYRHFKGNLYQIRCLARSSETREMMVVYQAMYDTFEIYVRPLSSFMEEVDHEKYPEAKQKYRFELLQDIDETADSYEEQSGEQPAGSHETRLQTRAVDFSEKQPQKKTENIMGIHDQDTDVFPEEQINIDPLVLEFLDANSYEQRLNILTSLRNRITDEMINTMAVAVDLEIKEGDVEDRYEELRNCLLTFEKYECNRLR